ncbi:MAG: CheR family methyltransferase, partial [Aestuariivirga sp.]
AKHHAGISLPGHKRNMVYRRVSKRLAALGLKDFGDYRALLLGPNAGAELQHFVNALTTNKTEFFRESHHFDHLLATVLPWLRKRAHGNPKLRIWSAGCSSGQEPYSIAMTLCGALADMSRWDAKILGTDIDTDMIERGRPGAYSHAEMLSLPGKFLSRYIEPVAGPGGRGRLAEAVRSLVTFNQLNLHGPWPMKAKFDAIFCRNVIIYFDAVDQSRLFNRFADHLHEGGYVYIGHSESLYRVTERFQPLGQSIYQRIA